MTFFSRTCMLAALAVCATACSDDDKDDHDHGEHDDTGGASATGGKTSGTGGTSATGGASSSGGTSTDGGDFEPDAKANFFVSSDTSVTGNLGGLEGADARCVKLAKAAGLTPTTWHAYLSAEASEGGAAVNAKDRIGTGPFYNVKGVELAADLDALHARKGDADVFIDENGQKIPGQWAGSPPPVAHDILTGSAADGTLLPGKTCDSWTSDSADLVAFVGHSDGLGPGMSGDPPYNSWNSSHENGGCNDTAPRGGAGRIYCFAP